MLCKQECFYCVANPFKSLKRPWQPRGRSWLWGRHTKGFSLLNFPPSCKRDFCNSLSCLFKGNFGPGGSLKKPCCSCRDVFPILLVPFISRAAKQLPASSYVLKCLGKGVDGFSLNLKELGHREEKKIQIPAPVQ